MPIANCIVTLDCHQNGSSLVDLWSIESGQSSDHMTVNIIASAQQLGKKYKVMANLFLPSLWPDSSISSLQIGLAKALAKTFDLPINEIHIITSIVEPGFVIESGEEEQW